MKIGLGTPQYISPEQAQGLEGLDQRTDIYSLGVVLFEMITGRVPFNTDTPFATVHAHIYTPLPLPSIINPNINPAIERMLLKALAKDAPDRYETAANLLEALEYNLTPQLTMTSKLREPKTSVEPSLQLRKSFPWWAWLGSALLGNYSPPPVA